MREPGSGSPSNEWGTQVRLPNLSKWLGTLVEPATLQSETGPHGELGDWGHPGWTLVTTTAGSMCERSLGTVVTGQWPCIACDLLDRLETRLLTRLGVEGRGRVLIVKSPLPRAQHSSQSEENNSMCRYSLTLSYLRACTIWGM